MNLYRPVGDTETPLSPQWQLLKVAPWSLVRLKDTINPLFPRGTIVALSNELLMAKDTPTMYEGQGVNPNSSTLVRIYVWRQETTVSACLSCDGGRAFNSIQDKHVINPITLQRAPRGGWPLGDYVKLVIPPNDATSYTTDRIHLPDDPRGAVKLPILNNTVGVVMKCMTATNRTRTTQQALTSKREDWWYVLRVGLRKTQWKWVKCQSWVAAINLEPLHPQHPDVVALHNLVVSTASLPPLLTVVSAP